MSVLPPSRWERVEWLFQEALERPENQRAAFLDAACAGDLDLRRDVAGLLDSAQAPDEGARIAGAAASEWAHSPAEELRGTTIDTYLIVALIGKGGMGEVYRAEDTALHRQVALKLLPTSYAGDAGRLRRFTDEARAASALNHPNILTVYSAGAVGGRRYIATELVDGDTVRARIARGPVPPREAIDIAIQVAAALGAAHAAGIVHRDIKPENIMVRRDGYVKVLDFGLAKLTRGPSDPAPRTLTRAGAVLGTLDYMAPEQAVGGDVDVRADLYSLAVVLYEMLAGALPRELGSGSDPASAGAPTLPYGAWRLLRRALATDPAMRYQSADELRRDLEALRRDIVARRVPRAWIVGLASGALIVAAGGGYWWATKPDASATPRSLIVMPLRAMGNAQEQAHLETGMADAIASRLAGVPELRVPPTAAIEAHEDPFAAAARLDAETVLTGSVERSGDDLRVTAQLSRASDHAQIWSARFDEKFTNIFQVEDTIAERIAASLVRHLSPRDRASLARRESADSDAYDLYLRARDQWSRRSPESIRTAIRMYQQAIAIDPRFALAYAGLADAYNVTVSGLPPATRFPLARAAAERALALDPSSAEAHNALAFLLYKFEWKWQESEQEFRRAIELDPKYALAHHWFGEYLGLLRRYPESIEQFRLALQFDPLSVPIRVDFLDVLVGAGRIADARAVLDAGMRIDRTNPRLLIASAPVLAAEGHEADGVEAELRGRLLLGAPEAEVDALRAAYHRGGMRAFDEQRVALLLEQVRRGALSVPGMSAATQLSLVYGRLGDREHALEWLTRSVDRGEDGALHLRVPVYDFLRGDPRYEALVGRVGIP